jgi:hypothetical protein
MDSDQIDRLLQQRLDELHNDKKAPIKVYSPLPTEDQLQQRLAALSCKSKANSNNSNNDYVSNDALIERWNKLNNQSVSQEQSNKATSNNNILLAGIEPIQSEEDEIDQLTDIIQQQIQLEKMNRTADSKPKKGAALSNADDLIKQLLSVRKEDLLAEIGALAEENSSDRDEENEIISAAIDAAKLERECEDADKARQHNTISKVKR